jgi:hypothetical protein
MQSYNSDNSYNYEFLHVATVAILRIVISDFRHNVATFTSFMMLDTLKEVNPSNFSGCRI